MLYKRLIWLKWWHPYNGALLYIKNLFHFLTFQNSKLPKTVAKKTKNMTSFSCFVQSADFLPYAVLHISWCVISAGNAFAPLWLESNALRYVMLRRILSYHVTLRFFKWCAWYIYISHAENAFTPLENWIETW